MSFQKLLNILLPNVWRINQAFKLLYLSLEVRTSCIRDDIRGGQKKFTISILIQNNSIYSFVFAR